MLYLLLCWITTEHLKSIIIFDKPKGLKLFSLHNFLPSRHIFGRLYSDLHFDFDFGSVLLFNSRGLTSCKLKFNFVRYLLLCWIENEHLKSFIIIFVIPKLRV